MQAAPAALQGTAYQDTLLSILEGLRCEAPRRCEQHHHMQPLAHHFTPCVCLDMLDRHDTPKPLCIDTSSPKPWTCTCVIVFHKHSPGPCPQALDFHCG